MAAVVSPLSAFWIIMLTLSLSERTIGPTSFAMRSSSYMAESTPMTTTT